MPIMLSGMTSYESYQRYFDPTYSIDLNFNFSKHGSILQQLESAFETDQLEIENLSKATTATNGSMGVVRYGQWSDYPNADGSDTPEFRKQALTMAPFVFRARVKKIPTRIECQFQFNNIAANNNTGLYICWGIGIYGEQTKTRAMPVMYLDFSALDRNNSKYGLFYNEGKTRGAEHHTGLNTLTVDMRIEETCPDSWSLMQDNTNWWIEWCQPLKLKSADGKLYDTTPGWFSYFIVR